MKTESNNGIYAELADVKSAELVSKIEKCCFTVPWTSESIAEDMNSRVSFYIVAYCGENAVGYISSHIVVDECEILRVAVLPEYRKRGTGTVLVAKMVELAENFNVSVVYLEVRTGNVAARTLYESAGFKFSGIRKKYYSDPVEDAAIYLKEIRK